MIRIVKMCLDPARTEDFLENFQAHKSDIRQFEGCEELRLLRDQKQPNVFFTYSKWKDPQDLENYRQSALFKGVWQFTKTLFADSPQAWSTDAIEEL